MGKIPLLRNMKWLVWRRMETTTFMGRVVVVVLSLGCGLVMTDVWLFITRLTFFFQLAFFFVVFLQLDLSCKASLQCIFRCVFVGSSWGVFSLVVVFPVPSLIFLSSVEDHGCDGGDFSENRRQHGWALSGVSETSWHSKVGVVLHRVGWNTTNNVIVLRRDPFLKKNCTVLFFILWWTVTRISVTSKPWTSSIRKVTFVRGYKSKKEVGGEKQSIFSPFDPPSFTLPLDSPPTKALTSGIPFLLPFASSRTNKNQKKKARTPTAGHLFSSLEHVLTLSILIWQTCSSTWYEKSTKSAKRTTRWSTTTPKFKRTTSQVSHGSYRPTENYPTATKKTLPASPLSIPRSGPVYSPTLSTHSSAPNPGERSTLPIT